MLIFNLPRALRLRGITEHQAAFLQKHGFVPATAYNFLKYTAASIKFDHLEKLCKILNCSPNDLFDWKPDEGETIGETHSLNVLKRKSGKDLSQMLKEVPMEKFEQIETLLEEMKNQPPQ